MSSLLNAKEQFLIEICPKPIPFNRYNNISIEDYDKQNISSSPIYKGYHLYNKCSESPNIPNFPFGGNTPPDTNYIKLIYLNYIANKSLEKKLYKLDRED